MTLFGPAGTADSFKAMGYKNTLQIANYLEKFGLTRFEYQCGRGVRIDSEKAAQIGEKLREKNIAVSLHRPYFISMSSTDEEKRLNSVNYILQSAEALNAMGGKRIIFHTGSRGKITREEAMTKALDTIEKMVAALDEKGYGNMYICPETMGKINQLGSLEEVLTLCKTDKRIIPCIDFGHLNARTAGGIKGKDDYLRIVDKINEALQDDRVRHFHAHFSKIEYTKGGEKKHLTFEDDIWGPEFEPLMNVLYENNLSPTVICESAGTQSEDAAAMKRYLEALYGQN